jgi:hypothetical protein
MYHRVGAVLLGLLVVSCATLEPAVPQSYAGPTAVVSDTHAPEDRSKGQFFVLTAIDGKAVNNALIESRRATYGRGFLLIAKNLTRDVPAQPMRVKLLATHATGAPIHAIASMAAGRYFSVEGEVMFAPKERGQYIVTGELTKERSSVWIQDLETNQPVTERIVSKGGRVFTEAVSSDAAPGPSTSGAPVTCDKWGNPKNADGTPCRQ